YATSSSVPPPLVLHVSRHPSRLPSFPTRRSSDLPVAVQLVSRGVSPRRERQLGIPLAVAPELAHGSDPHLDRRIVRKDHSARSEDRKSTRLNSSHVSISYAVFCLKKKIYPVCRRV